MEDYAMRTAICPTQLHFRKLVNHFVGLTSGDRFLRFGWVATDVDIVSYVESLFESAARVFVAIEPDGDISGVLHLEFTEAGANLGLSVSSWARNQGIGSLLLQRAGLLVRARGLNALFVRNLRFNTALQRLAFRLGINVACTARALIARSQIAAMSGQGIESAGFCGRIALVDDTLRSQWDGTAIDAAPFDSPRSIPSGIERDLSVERLAVQ
jgi:GNAT superfamily N-acetyltransferase